MAIMNFTKSTIGAGVLFLPFALASSALFPGLALLVYGAVTMTYSLHMISRMSVSAPRDFMMIAKGLFGFKGEVITAVFQIVFLLTPLTAYIKLIGIFADIALKEFFPSLDLSTSLVSIVCAVALIFPLTLLNNLSKLSFVSVFGMICVAYIFGLVVIDFLADVFTGSLPPHTITYFKLDFGILSSFSAIILGNVNQPSVLPVLSSLENPSSSRKKILIFGTQTMVFIVYFLVALFGYLHFGDELLKVGHILGGKKTMPYILGGIITAISLILTYPLILFPTRLTLNWLLVTAGTKCLPSLTARFRGTYILFLIEGVLILSLTLFLALIFPTVTQVLDVFIPVGGAYISFIFPAISFLKMKKTLQISRSEYIGAIICAVTGVAVMLVGTPVAIMNLFA